MTIDLIFILFAMLGFFYGYRRGIIKTLFYVGSIFFGILIAIRITPPVVAKISGMLNMDKGMVMILTLIAMLIITILLIRFIGSKVEDLLKSAKMNGLNKMLGGVVLGLFATLIYSSILLFTTSIGVVSSKTKDQSHSFKYLITFPETVKKASPVFTKFIKTSIEAFKDESENLN